MSEALPQKSGQALGSGQYRNAVASGQLPSAIFLGVLCYCVATRRYRVTVLTRSKDSFRVLRQTHSTTSLQWPRRSDDPSPPRTKGSPGTD